MSAMGTKVPRQDRVISEKALAMVLEQATYEVTGEHLSKAAVCVMLAQAAVEQGASPTGVRVTKNWNTYGLKAWNPTQDHFVSETKEGHGENEHVEVAKFRSFQTPLDGAKAYVGLIAKEERYKLAWPLLLQGDYAGYAIEIGPHYLPNGQLDRKRGGYYTADPTKYVAAISRRWSECALRQLNYGVSGDEIRRFQKEHNIGVDGLIGPVTRKALMVALVPVPGAASPV